MSNDQDAIAQVFGEYAASLNAGDIDRWMKLWDADGIQMPPDGAAAFGHAEIRTRNGESVDKYYWVMTVDLKETEIAGNWAYGRGFYTATLTPKQEGDDILVDGKFLTILKRQSDGAWKFYRDSFNSNVPG